MYEIDKSLDDELNAVFSSMSDDELILKAFNAVDNMPCFFGDNPADAPSNILMEIARRYTALVQRNQK